MRQNALHIVGAQQARVNNDVGMHLLLVVGRCLVGRCGGEVQALESRSIPSAASSRLCGLDNQLSEPQRPHPLSRGHLVYLNCLM